MSASNATETNLLELIFRATVWTNIAQNDASGPDANIVVSLQTADPGEAGDMTTSEISYTNYVRINVARTGTPGWTVTGNSVSPNAAITFASSGGGTGGTVTHFCTGKLGGGAQPIWFSGTVTPNIVVTSGVQPSLTTATAITCE